MAATYQLRLRSATGTLLAILAGEADGGFLSLTYTKAVNAAGLLVFELNADSAAAALLVHRGIVEVWRADAEAGIDWYRDFTGLILRRSWTVSDVGRVTVYCPGLLWLLGTRHVLWPAGTANRSEFTSAKAETIAKTLVSYNVGASATTGNGRSRNGAITGLTVQADAAGGNTLDLYCAWDNLLEALQGLAAVGGGDFDLVQTGNAAFDYRWYAGQLGTDRTATVIFALERGNMAEAEYDDDRQGETNVVAVLGQGEGASRAVVIRTAGDADVETTADARNEATTAALNAVGDRRLAEGARRQTFEFDAMQTPACVYGLHFFLGDLVTARLGTVIEVTRKIVAVNVTLEENGREVIEPEFGAP
jgi:hypothetical protein